MEREGKLWNGQKNTVKLYISLYGPTHCLRIWKDVVRVLGGPQYISFRLNKDMSSMLIECAEEKHKLSFKIADDFYLNAEQEMKVISTSFVEGLMIRNELDLAESYHVEGVYSEKNNVVVFNLRNAEKLCNEEET